MTKSLTYGVFAVLAVGATSVLLVALFASRNQLDTGQDGKSRLVSYKRRALPKDVPGVIEEPGCVVSGRIGGHDPTLLWRAAGTKGNRYLSIGVCAGALTDEPETGYLTVSQSWLPGTKRLDYEAYVPFSGEVRITHAPLGWKATRRVWKGPRIWFEGETGIYGYLDLHPNSVRITAGPVAGVCPEGTAGDPPDCVILRPYLSDFRVTPKVRWKRRGETFSFLVKVKNSGNAPATNLNFCVETPPRMIKGDTWNCFVFEQLPAGTTARHRFRFKLSNRVKRGGRYTLGFLATSPINYGYVTWPGDKYARRTVRILKSQAKYAKLGAGRSSVGAAARVRGASEHARG